MRGWEILIGFWPGCALGGCRDLRELDSVARRALEKARCSQLGDAFRAGVVVWLVGQGLHRAGLWPWPPALRAIQEAFFKCAAKRKACALEQTRLGREVPPMRRFGAFARRASEQPGVELMDSLTIEMLRRADRRGGDGGLDAGVPFRCSARSRVSVDARRWVWQRAVAAKFARPVSTSPNSGCA